jgi:hypothetical protein
MEASAHSMTASLLSRMAPRLAAGSEEARLSREAAAVRRSVENRLELIFYIRPLVLHDIRFVCGLKSIAVLLLFLCVTRQIVMAWRKIVWVDRLDGYKSRFRSIQTRMT